MEIQNSRYRKLLLVLPLLVLPFLFLAFYAIGGGKTGDMQPGNPGAQRLNMQLPGAAFLKPEPEDKMGFYQQYQRDSAARPDRKTGKYFPPTNTEKENAPAPDEQIEKKLDALDRELRRAPVPVADPKRPLSAAVQPVQAMDKDVDRLESLMQSMQQKEEDPEMAQLQTMLETILAIQHPEKTAVKPPDTAKMKSDSLFQSVPAIVARKQKAVQGASLELRLTDSLRVGAYLIPKGHPVFGICRISNQRLMMDIQNIRLNQAIIPVRLTVYDLDGMPGIDAPEAILPDALNTGASDAVSSISLPDIGASIGAQAAGAGIAAARSLFHKKVKRIKVRLQAGRPLLLRNAFH